MSKVPTNIEGSVCNVKVPVAEGLFSSNLLSNSPCSPVISEITCVCAEGGNSVGLLIIVL